MTEGVCIMASMKEDRGELDLTKRVEELEKALSIALDINDRNERWICNRILLRFKFVILFKRYSNCTSRGMFIFVSSINSSFKIIFHIDNIG